MTRALAVVREAERLGAALFLAGSEVEIEIPASFPDALLHEMRMLRDEIRKALLVAALRDRFEERAGILEFDAGLTRVEAERQARAEMVARWLAANPLAPSGDTRCAHCDGPLGADAIAVLAGGGHTWLHPECHAPLRRQRERQALAALGWADGAGAVNRRSHEEPQS